MNKSTSRTKNVDKGSTFKALGIPQPETAKIKSDIALAIYQAIQSQGHTQREAAAIMGVDQAKVSAITRGITKGYSVERLLVFLNRLDIDVDIEIAPKSKRSAHGETRVTSSAIHAAS
jgi:predicted XRE-type DNA-binding protein